MKERFKYLDYSILLPFLILGVIGVIMVFSASSGFISELSGNYFFYLIRQAIFFGIGIVIVFVVYFIKIDFLKSNKFLGIALMVIIMALLMLIILGKIFPSQAINGANAWFKLGPLSIQPAEFAKVIVILYLASIISKREAILTEADTLGEVFVDLKTPLLVTMLIAFLILLQPDLGGFSILMAIIIVMIIVSGIKPRLSGKLMAWISGILIVFYFLLRFLPINFMSQSYMMRRLMAFVHPFELENKGGQQLVNSYYAIHNGGFFGLGLGNSIQKRGYLPEPYTDFIFSITAEELGLVGVIIILGLLCFLIFRIYQIGVKSKIIYRAELCFGIATMMFIQVIFNVGGLLGLLPITGVTLPFISYGGSSMIVLTFCIGIVLKISAKEKKYHGK